MPSLTSPAPRRVSFTSTPAGRSAIAYAAAANAAVRRPPPPPTEPECETPDIADIFIEPQVTPTRKAKRIKAIGVELEGAWHNPPPNEIHHDGSVTARGNHVGEVSSQPISSLELAEEWVRANYPHVVNSSCGLHVHLSTNELNYSRLMEPEFYEFFNGRMTEFLAEGQSRNAPGFDLFRQRFDGLNRYCQKKFIPHEQLFRTEAYGNTDQHPRYSQLNFCYSRHGTVECRMFPCFPNVSDGVAAVKSFYNTVFDYLGQFKSTKDDQSETLVIPLSALKA